MTKAHRRFVFVSLITSFLAAACLLTAFSSSASAAMTLTPAGIDLGFSLTTFADQIPANGSGVGPVGIASFGANSVIVSGYANGTTRIFDDVDGQHYTTTGVAGIATFGGNDAAGLTVLGGNIYMALQSSGKVVQLNNDGSINHTLAGSFPAPPASTRTLPPIAFMSPTLSAAPHQKSILLLVLPPRPSAAVPMASRFHPTTQFSMQKSAVTSLVITPPRTPQSSILDSSVARTVSSSASALLQETSTSTPTSEPSSRSTPPRSCKRQSPPAARAATWSTLTPSTAHSYSLRPTASCALYRPPAASYPNLAPSCLSSKSGCCSSAGELAESFSSTIRQSRGPDSHDSRSLCDRSSTNFAPCRQPSKNDARCAMSDGRPVSEWRPGIDGELPSKWHQRLMLLVIPAKAGIQAIGTNFWIPAGAGMTHSNSKDQWPRCPQ